MALLPKAHVPGIGPVAAFTIHAVPVFMKIHMAAATSFGGRGEVMQRFYIIPEVAIAALRLAVRTGQGKHGIALMIEFHGIGEGRPPRRGMAGLAIPFQGQFLLAEKFADNQKTE